ncbi:hypothetical protein SAMN04488038_105176 [Solimonas aquatica]|uniref:Uncharacterized protein n=1 Tax=Solimonas aquatica TaxID=489703 RepID=A0A1H9EY46_9GAMM|nr:hypothetical protein [Solimonas aquatica]SEQ29898.1 hypothetical protein SAMN04488038_105176 [Solimonas aquatica]
MNLSPISAAPSAGARISWFSLFHPQSRLASALLLALAFGSASARPLSYTAATVEPMPAGAQGEAAVPASPDGSAEPSPSSELAQGGDVQAKAGAGSAIQLSTPASYSANFSTNTAHIAVAKVSNTSSTVTSGALRLELWASKSDYNGGSLNGYRLAVLPLHASGSSSTQLAPGAYFHDISQDVLVDTVPPPGTYYPVLMVTEYTSACTSNDGYCFDDYLKLTPQLQVASSGGTSSNAVEVVGATSSTPDYLAQTVRFKVAELHNGSLTRTSGSLRLELWATTSAYSGGSISGYRMAVAPLAGLSNTNSQGTLRPAGSFTNLDTTVPISSQPPQGSYSGTLIVSEYNQSCGTSDGYCIVDWVSYADPYQVPLTSVPDTSGNLGGGGGGALGWLSLSLLGLGAGFARVLRRR